MRLKDVAALSGDTDALTHIQRGQAMLHVTHFYLFKSGKGSAGTVKRSKLDTVIDWLILAMMWVLLGLTTISGGMYFVAKHL